MQPVINSFVNDFFVPVVEVVLPVLAAVVLNECRKWLSTKKVVNENEALRYELDSLASDAVAYAEEVSHQMLRLSGEKVPSKKKEDIAVNILLDSAKKHNLSVDRARKLVLISLGTQFRRHVKV